MTDMSPPPTANSRMISTARVLVDVRKKLTSA